MSDAYQLTLGGRERTDELLAAMDRDAILAEVLAPHLTLASTSQLQEGQKRESVSLGSEHFAVPEPQLVDPPPAERIADKLDQLENGNLEAWWYLNMEMTLEPNSTHYGDELVPDLTTLPGWRDANSGTRERIVRGAKRYIQEADPQTQEWLGTNDIFRPAFAGYRALRLLMDVEPAFLNCLGPGEWEAWTPIILAYPTETGTEKERPVRRLVALAYPHAPDEVISTLNVLIDQDNERFDTVFDIRKVEDCWDERLADAVVRKAGDEKLKPGCVESLLDAVAERGFEVAFDYARSLLPESAPVAGDRDKAVVGAGILLTRREQEAWPSVWPLMREDEGFGRAVAIKVAGKVSWNRLPFGDHLGDEQLADLYIWLSQQYPRAEDNIPAGWHEVDEREEIARWRDSLLTRLQMRAKATACEAIARIADELPHLDWLRWTLLEALILTRRKTWAPFDPDEIRRLLENADLRIVRDSDQLLDVVVESLNRLQKRLQRQETPLARYLWDKVPEVPKGRKIAKAPKVLNETFFRPVDENTLSDYLKVHLQDELRDRGIILGREVVIRQGYLAEKQTGRRPGQRTDIQVSVSVPQPDGLGAQTLTVVAEVKGVWNTGLWSSIKCQLVDRYLEQNGLTHGLYVVGWFNDEAWDPVDPNRSKNRKRTLKEAQDFLDAQATKLSTGGKRVQAVVLDISLG